MRYGNIKKAEFVVRRNRFICDIFIDGKKEDCHVKNTGRLRELLVTGAEVYVEVSDNPARKTKYDLIAVVKDGKIINIDIYAFTALLDIIVSIFQLTGKGCSST